MTAHTSWTSYRTSNPSIVNVTEDGLVTAAGEGVAYITASNTGATSVTLIQVAKSAIFVDVEGLCRINGVPAVGVSVDVLGVPIGATTGNDGRFLITGVPVVSREPIRVRAELDVSGVLLAGTSGVVYPRPGFITDAGFIELVEQSGIPNPGFESGDFTGFVVAGNTRVEMQLGAVVSPEGAYMGLASTSPVGSGGAITAQTLTVPTGTAAIAWDWNFLTDELDNDPVYNDTFVATVIPSNGIPVEVMRVAVADLRAGTWPALPAPTGFDAMTGFLPGSLQLAGVAAPGETIELNFAVFDVGDPAGDTTILIDNLRWE